MNTRNHRSRLAAVALGLGASFLACQLLVLALPVSAWAVWTLDTTRRTEGEIRYQWQARKPVYAGAAYSTAPRLAAPYTAGALTAGFLSDGLNMLNFARYLAGLPDDVTLDSALNNEAQHASVLIAVGTFSHTPPKPSDMDQAFYDLGYAGTSSSNLGWGYGDLETFNKSCLEDDDASNIDRVGHRRWLLNPPLKKTGMGWADTRCATHVFDWSRTEAVSYSAVRWPSEGYFPVEFFGSYVPWSISVDPAKYTIPAASAVTVTLRESGGATWTFTSADTNKSGEYFNLERSGYGINNCFIFRPAPSSVSYQPGDVFDVTLSGLTQAGTGAAVTLSYRTTFMTLTGPVTQPTTSVFRIGGADRYAVAAEAARRGWDPAGDHSWPGVRHVVVACGLDGKEPDALGAAGVAGVYDAPVLLVRPNFVPAATQRVVAEIAAKNPGVQVHIVGGPASVPDAIGTSLRAIPGVSKVRDRLGGSDRYAVSASIAQRMMSVVGAAAIPGAIVVNSESSSAFFDAMSASPVAFSRHMPMLSVRKGYIPASVKRFLDSLPGKPRYLASGTGYLSESVRVQAGAAERMATSSNRLTASKQIADFSLVRGWLACTDTSLGSKLPDALTGGAFAGHAGGPLLLTDSTGLSVPPEQFISGHAGDIARGWILGGTASVSSGTEQRFGLLLD